MKIATGIRSGSLIALLALAVGGGAGGRAAIASSDGPLPEPSPGPRSVLAPMPCPRSAVPETMRLVRYYPLTAALPSRRVVQTSRVVQRLYSTMCRLTPVKPGQLHCSPGRNGSGYHVSFLRNGAILLRADIVMNRCRFVTAQPPHAPATAFYPLPPKLQSMVASALGVSVQDLVR
jgi:hypothetical protein